MDGAKGPIFRVVQGVIVGLIHHTQKETFTEVEDVLHSFVRTLIADTSAQKLEMVAKLLYTTSTTRRGDRVTDWDTAADLVVKLWDTIPEAISCDETAWEVAKAGAVILQLSPMNVFIPKSAKLMERIQEYQV